MNTTEEFCPFQISGGRPADTLFSNLAMFCERHLLTWLNGYEWPVFLFLDKSRSDRVRPELFEA